MGMSESTACAHERTSESIHTDVRETGPVKTVTVRCVACGAVVRTSAHRG